MEKPKDLEFVGRNIRLLRRRSGLTIAELAEQTGMREASLGRVERGKSAPSARVLFNLSKVLKVPLDAIFAETTARLEQLRGEAAGRPCFTCMGRPELPGNIAEKANAVIDAYLGLEDLCGARKSAGIPFQLFFYKNELGIEELAAAVRGFLGVEHSVVFDYAELLEANGFRVISVDFLDTLASCSYFDSQYRNAFFFLNRNFNAEKQLFSLAYELGMVYMWGNRGIQNQNDEFSGDEAHRVACKFAAFFLMPREAVQKSVRQLGIKPENWTFELLVRIKQRFGVSAESFLYRLRELKLIDETAYRTVKNAILAFYEAHDYKEPGTADRVGRFNSRLGDLLVAAQSTVASSEALEEVIVSLEQLGLKADA